MQRKYYFVLFLFFILSVVVFKDFVFHARPPFPGNYMQAWYEPWRSLNFRDGQIRLPHKPVVDDAFRHILPFRLFGIEKLKSFELPLWNPYNGAGQPLLATLNSGFLDPMNVLYAVFPVGVAHGIVVMLQFILVGCSMYIYTRSLELRRVTAMFAGIVYSLSGFAVIRYIFTNYGMAVASIPLAFASIEYAVRKRNAAALFVIPVLMAVSIVSTQPQMTVYLLMLIGVYGVVRLWSARKWSGLFVILFVLGITLAGAQLIPTYELMKNSHVQPGDSMDVVRKYLMPVEFLRSIPIPNFYGNTATYNYWGGRSDSIQTASYIGILPVLLALVSLRYLFRRRAITPFFAFAAALSAALAVEWPGSLWFYRQPIPILSTGAPSRFFAVTTIALTVLAALGLDEVLSRKTVSRWLIAVLILTIGGTTWLLWYTYKPFAAGLPCPMLLPQSCHETAFRNTALAVIIFVPQLFILAVLPFLRGKFVRFRFAFISMLLLIVAAGGIYNAYKALPQAPSTDLYPELPVIRALRDRTTDARVIGIGEAEIAADLATQFRIYDPQFYHPLYIYRYRELLEYANNGRYISQYPRGDASIKNYLRVDQELINRRDRVFNLTSTKYRMFKKEELAGDVPGGSTVWEDDTWLLTSSSSALPRAYLVSDVRHESSPAGILSVLFDSDFDYRHAAVVEEPVPVSDNADALSGKADIVRYGAHDIEISVSTSRQALLVLTDAWYPGWKAWVDGEPAFMYRANYVFRAVPVPAGEHSVLFRYEPDSVRYGLSVSIASAIALLILFQNRKRLLA